MGYTGMFDNPTCKQTENVMLSPVGSEVKQKIVNGEGDKRVGGHLRPIKLSESTPN